MTDDDFLAAGLEPGWLEAQTVERAKAGDRDAALDVLHFACVGLLARSLDIKVADYLADCLMQAHSALTSGDERPGDALAKAFNLTREKGRPANRRTAERDSDLALWVHLAVQECGISLADAKTMASELFVVENVDRVLKKEGPVTPPENLDPCFEYFHMSKRPLPARR